MPHDKSPLTVPNQPIPEPAPCNINVAGPDCLPLFFIHEDGTISPDSADVEELYSKFSAQRKADCWWKGSDNWILSLCFSILRLHQRAGSADSEFVKMAFEIQQLKKRIAELERGDFDPADAPEKRSITDCEEISVTISKDEENHG